MNDRKRPFGLPVLKYWRMVLLPTVSHNAMFNASSYCKESLARDIVRLNKVSR